MYLRLTHCYPLALCAAFLFSACLEKPADGTVFCDPDVPSDCPGGFVCKPHACPDDYRCYARVSGGRDYYAPGCLMDGYCDVETCERVWNCVDCVPRCDLSLAAGPPQDYLVSSYVASRTAEDPRWVGLNIGGDAGSDNKWGQIAYLLDSNVEADLHEELALQIASGHLLIAARVYPEQTADPESLTMVQLLLVEVHDATPVFDGLDRVRLVEAASSVGVMCGRLSEQRFGTPLSGAAVRFPIPSPWRGATAVVEAHPFFVEGDVSPSGWQEVTVGGGMSVGFINHDLLPATAALITQKIAADPMDPESETLASLFDGNCVVLDDEPGCESVVEGEGECDDRADPPVITVTELKCNALLHSALAPDVDLDGDGVDDTLSFGARLSAVPVTIVEN